MPAVSFIVPIYNSEQHLDNCINSILNQSSKDFELLLINDGSTDTSNEICDEFAQKDNRIRVFHKENGGVSSARNLGLRNAKGKWVLFVDSDDEIKQNYLEALIQDSKGQDLVIHSTFLTHPISKEKKVMSSFPIAQSLSPAKLFKNFMVTSNGYPFNKIFNNNIIQKHQISFDENISFAEDALFLLDYLLFCKSIFVSNSSNYIYYETEGSLRSKRYPVEQEFYLLEKAKIKLSLIFEENQIKKDHLFYKEMQYFLFRVLRSIFDLSKKTERIKYLRQIFASYYNEFLVVYKKSRGRGRIAYFLIKYRKIHSLEFYLKNFILK